MTDSIGSGTGGSNGWMRFKDIEERKRAWSVVYKIIKTHISFDRRNLCRSAHKYPFYYEQPGKKSPPHGKKVEKYENELRASFWTKSMSLNVSGKHNNVKECVFFFLDGISRFPSEQPYSWKNKVQWEVHFCEVNWIFASFVNLFLNYLFGFYAIAMHGMQTKREKRSTQFQKFRWQRGRHKSTFCIIIFLSCYVRSFYLFLLGFCSFVGLFHLSKCLLFVCSVHYKRHFYFLYLAGWSFFNS